MVIFGVFSACHHMFSTCMSHGLTSHALVAMHSVHHASLTPAMLFLTPVTQGCFPWPNLPVHLANLVHHYRLDLACCSRQCNGFLLPAFDRCSPHYYYFHCPLLPLFMVHVFSSSAHHCPRWSPTILLRSVQTHSDTQ